MTDNAEIGSINKEQKAAIDKLEEVLNFLKSAQIKDGDVLVHIKKPLDDIQSSLKYIPTRPYFEIIPTEIKTKILNYLCDTNAFTAASVCVDWKDILGSRFTGRIVTIGERCCSYQCRDKMCLIDSEILKAAATHKLDVLLTISYSVRELDSKLVTDALTSVSRFSITGDCTCHYGINYDDSDGSFDSSSTEYECQVNPLSIDQLEDLFKGVENKIEAMEVVQLKWLDLTELNQDRLVNCFVKKIKNLTLSEGSHGIMISVETLVNKLSQESAELKLNQLTLDMEYPEELALELANAVCNVENIKLDIVRRESVAQLIENILMDTRPVMIKTLIIESSWEPSLMWNLRHKSKTKYSKDMMRKFNNDLNIDLDACDMCDKKYTKPNNLQTHKRIMHEGIRFPCDMCDFKAKSMRNHKSHKNSIHEKITVPCDICDKVYTHPQNLQQHQETEHKGIFYLCDQCDYKGTQWRYLQNHVEKVHEGILFQCYKCENRYTLKSILKGHIKKHHNVLEIKN